MNWKAELESLKDRGVNEIDLIVSNAMQGIENAVCTAFPKASPQFCVTHVKRQILGSVTHKDKTEVERQLDEVFVMEDKTTDSLSGYQHFTTFVCKWERKYPALKKYKAKRNVAYFTYMDFPTQLQRCIYTTNWIERLNRKYKRTIKMRAVMPSEKSVVFLLGAVAKEEAQNTYKRKIYQFKYWKKQENNEYGGNMK